MSFHTQPRATSDIELLIKPGAGHAMAGYAALSRFAVLQGPGGSKRLDPWEFSVLLWDAFSRYPEGDKHEE